MISTVLIEVKIIGGFFMATKVTSKKVASTASKVLRDGRTSKDSKAVAASALSQREKRGK
jgi:hypothetical protein